MGWGWVHIGDVWQVAKSRGEEPGLREGVGTGAAAQPIDDTKTALLPRQALDVT